MGRITSQNVVHLVRGIIKLLHVKEDQSAGVFEISRDSRNALQLQLVECLQCSVKVLGETFDLRSSQSRLMA